MCIYIYIYTYTHFIIIITCMYLYIYIYRERERDIYTVLVEALLLEVLELLSGVSRGRHLRKVVV